MAEASKVGKISGLGGTYNDIGEKSGFQTSGYQTKKGTPQGEGAMLNVMPPGMDITNQPTAAFNSMPLKQVVSESFPGDGWMPSPRDVAE